MLFVEMVHAAVYLNIKETRTENADLNVFKIMIVPKIELALETSV